jgi:OmpA-like transmembrane domain.
MRYFSKRSSMLAILAIAGSGAPACWAQKWEVGVLGGGSLYNTDSVTSPFGSGQVGIKNGLAVGAYVGSDMNKLFGGELRYEYLPGDLKLSSSGTETTFGGQTQAVHYDFLFHFASTEARIRPFVAVGGGVKFYEGTSKATVTQPLSGLALLTNTHETKGMAVFGGGVKAKIAPRVSLRFEVNDFLTPFPRQVIAPAPGAKISGLLHDIVFMGGLGIMF